MTTLTRSADEADAPARRVFPHGTAKTQACWGGRLATPWSFRGRWPVVLPLLLLAGVTLLFRNTNLDLTISSWFYQPETGRWPWFFSAPCTAFYRLGIYPPFVLVTIGGVWLTTGWMLDGTGSLSRWAVSGVDDGGRSGIDRERRSQGALGAGPAAPSATVRRAIRVFAGRLAGSAAAREFVVSVGARGDRVLPDGAGVSRQSSPAEIGPWIVCRRRRVWPVHVGDARHSGGTFRQRRPMGRRHHVFPRRDFGPVDPAAIDNLSGGRQPPESDKSREPDDHRAHVILSDSGLLTVAGDLRPPLRKSVRRNSGCAVPVLAPTIGNCAATTVFQRKRRLGHPGHRFARRPPRRGTG